MDVRIWVAAIAVASLACVPQPDGVSLPNVVFILADDMGWGDVESYNPESLTQTPNINRLADEGLSFMDAHSGSAICSPTRYGIMTGRAYWRTYKRHSLVMPYDPPVIPPERLTWGTLMQERGYTTAYVGKWHLGLWYPAKPTGGWQRQYTMNEDEVDFSKAVEGGPTDLGFDYFFGNAGGPNNDSPYAFLRDDRWVEVPEPAVQVGLHGPSSRSEAADSQQRSSAVRLRSVITVPIVVRSRVLDGEPYR